MKGVFTILNYYFSPGRRAAQWPLTTAPAAVGDRNLQRLGWRLKMSVFEDIKNGLLQAITFEKERKAIRSHFERSKKDIKDGRVLLAEEAIESVADELISFSCLNENGRGRSQTTTDTKKK